MYNNTLVIVAVCGKGGGRDMHSPHANLRRVGERNSTIFLKIKLLFNTLYQVVCSTVLGTTDAIHVCICIIPVCVYVLPCS